MFEVRDGPGARRDGSGFASGPEAERRVSGHRVRETRWFRAGSPAEVMRVLTAAQARAELSKADLARELGITQSQVVELIAGRKAPSVLLMVRWLGVCGWDLMAVER